MLAATASLLSLIHLKSIAAFHGAFPPTLPAHQQQNFIFDFPSQERNWKKKKKQEEEEEGITLVIRGVVSC